MTTFVYFVLPRTSPGVGIFLLCGVFFFQTCVDFYKTPYRYWCQNNRYIHDRHGYDLLTASYQKQSKFEYLVKVVQVVLENKVMKIIALILQVMSIIAFVVVSIAVANKNAYGVTMTISYCLIILILSVVWSDWFQLRITEPFKKNTLPQNKNISARYKSCK